MKKILSILALSATLILAGLSLVACGETETYSYALNADGNSYTLASYSGTETYVTVPAYYEGKAVTAIGGSAFSGRAVSGVVLPDSVTSIGNSAFENCSGLKAVVMDGATKIGNYAFSGCSSLASVSLGNAVKEIRTGTFYNCKALKEIKIPSGVKSIGDYAFYSCTSLEIIDLPDTIDSLGTYSFAGCVKLQEATVGNGVKNIKNKAFYNCKAMTAINIGSSVLTIESRAFDGCAKLETVVLPYGIETVGDYAFANCGELANVVIPNSITRVGHNAFDGCVSLNFNSDYVAPEQTESENKVDPNADKTGLYLGNASNPYLVLVKTKSATVDACAINPATVVIADYALSNCTLIKSIVVPDSVLHIGDSAFASCSSLSSLTLGENVVTVGKDLIKYSSVKYNVYENGGYLGSATNPYLVLLQLKSTEVDTFAVNDRTEVIATEAFAECNNLVTVETMRSVKSIGDRAFAYCRELTELPVTDKLAFVGEDAFLRCNKLLNEKDGLIYVKSGEDNKILVGVANAKADELAECELDEDVTVVAKNALPSNYYITKITLNKSLNSISNNFFAYCNGLKTIEAASENATFSAKGGILYDKEQYFAFVAPRCLTGNVILSDKVSYIQPNLFAPCIELTGIGVEDGNVAFSAKDGILLNKDKTEIISVPAKISGELVLPDTLQVIDDGAFYDRAGVTKIILPNSVTSIGAYAFYGCTCEIEWSEDGESLLTAIGDYAFNGYKGTSILVPLSVTVIGEQAFAYCDNMTSITLPNCITEIGDGAFYGCTALTEFGMPETVTKIGENAFYGCTCEIVWGNATITEIGDHAFYGYNGVTFEIPETVTTIGTQAFGGCDKLTEIDLTKIKTVGNGAFYNCGALAEVTLSTELESIGGYAFNECGALKTITFNGTIADWDAVEKNPTWNFSKSVTKVECLDGTKTIK